MIQTVSCRRPTLLSAVFLALSFTASAETDIDSPKGRWVTEHPSQGGIGSWWDFRTDGTFSFFQGAMVTSPVTHTADTLTLPPTTAGGSPNLIKYRIEGGILHLVTPAGTDLAYNRVGSAPDASDALLGKWRPVPPKTPSTDPKTAAMERSNTLALYVFGADGTESVRIPFSARRGTWDAKAHTFQFQGDSVAYPFHFSYGKLELGQPPDGKKVDTYIADTLL